GYFLPISAKRSSQYGIVIEMPFDLVHEVRCLPRLRASSNAYFRIRSVPFLENVASWVTTSRSVPSYIRPPTLPYSPSVFSRITTRSEERRVGKECRSRW